MANSEFHKFIRDHQSMFSGYPAFVWDMNLFSIDTYDHDATRKTLLEIGSHHSSCAVCLKNIDPVLDSIEVMEMILSQEILIYQYGNPQKSFELHKAMRTFRTLYRRDTPQSLNALGVQSLKTKANNLALELKDTLDEIESSGKSSYRSIATELTKRKIPSPNNKEEWNAMSVKRIKNRLKDLGLS